MSGIEPPREPPAPPQLVFPLTVPVRRRSRVPAIIGIAVAGAVGFAVAGFLFSATASSIADSADRTAAERVVLALDSAYEKGDCDAFEAVTTDDVRGDMLGKNYDCDAFEAAADALTDDGNYAYSVAVVRTAKFDDTVVVTTREAYGDEVSARYSYLLENEDGRWVIVEYGRL